MTAYRDSNFVVGDTVAVPAATQVGNEMIAFTWKDGNVALLSDPTPPAGWTQIAAQQATRNSHPALRIRANCFRKTAVSGDLGSDAEFITSQFTAILSYSGVDSTTPVEDIQTTNQDEPPGTTTPLLPSLTALGTNRRAVYYAATCDAEPTGTPPSGYTERKDNFGDSMGDRVFGSAGATGTQAMSIALNGAPHTPAFIGIHLLLKPAAPAAVQPGVKEYCNGIDAQIN